MLTSLYLTLLISILIILMTLSWKLKEWLQKPLCVVREFTNSEEAMNYFNAIKQSEGIFKDVDPEGVTPFIISKTNYSKLMETGKTDQYLIFFKENYR